MPESITNNAFVAPALTQLLSTLSGYLNKTATTLNGKLNTTNNFNPATSGLVSTDIQAAILELKSQIDALNTVYQTDAEAAVAIQAVNDAWAAADQNITTLVNSKLDASAYTASDVMAKVLSQDGIGSGLDADLLGGKPHSVYLTVDDIIDLGEV